MAKDISDAGQAGISIADLLAAARTGDPLGIKGRAAQEAAARQGLGVLTHAVTEAEIAQTAHDAVKLLTGIMEKDKIARLGLAYHFDRPSVSALLLRARALRGVSATATELLDQIRAAAAPMVVDDNPDTYRGLKVPFGYNVDDHGVFMNGERGRKTICPAPFLIAGIATDLDTGDELLELQWRRRKKWVSRVVERDRVMDSRKLVALSKGGAPISSSTANAVVQYLQAFEALNINDLKEKASTNHLGWAGKHFVMPNHSHPKGATLRDDGDGVFGISRAIAPKGNWEGWCEVVKKYVAPRPLAMLGIYAAACTVVLKVLKTPGFCMDWSGETSLGKTTVLRGCASVWGNPDDNGEGIIFSWASSSDVGPTTIAWFLQSLPVILDDTKRGRPDVVGNLMYSIPAGQAKTRGAKEGGIQARQTWRTCLLSTGEAPITSFKQDGGAVARTICLRGSPLGGASDANRRAAEAIDAGFAKHHGHLGPRLLEHLFKQKSVELRKRFDDLVQLYAGENKGAVGGRMAKYVAVLALTQQLVHEVGCPMYPKGGDPIYHAMEATHTGGDIADRPREALTALFRWASGNRHRFWQSGMETSTGHQPPHGGYVGKWNRYAGEGRPHWMCIYPEIVKKLLREWEYDVAAVLEAWDRRQWTEETVSRAGKRRRQVKVKIDGASPWMIAFDMVRAKELM